MRLFTGKLFYSILFYFLAVLLHRTWLVEWFAFTFHEIHYPRYLGFFRACLFFVTYCPLIKENLDQSYYCMVKYNGLAKVWVDVYRCDCSALYYSSPHAAFCSLSKIEHALSNSDSSIFPCTVFKENHVCNYVSRLTAINRSADPQAPPTL